MTSFRHPPSESAVASFLSRIVDFVPRGRTPAEPVLVGVYQPGAPGDVHELKSVALLAHRAPEVVHWYQHWGGETARFDGRLLERVDAFGAIPMITWEPWRPGAGVNQSDYSLAAIVSGRYDGYVRQWADSLRTFGKRVLLRWGHEMNDRHYPWGRGVNGNRDADYVAAWRHLRTLFRDAGAENVEWVWSPNVIYEARTRFESLYPGDEWVDWLAVDGFNHPRWAGGWQSFSDLFRESYDRLIALPQATPKPIMIAEWAAVEHEGQKARWITDAFATIPRWRRLRAIVWFNERQPDADWRFESSPAALRAFQDGVRSLRKLERENVA